MQLFSQEIKPFKRPALAGAAFGPASLFLDRSAVDRSPTTGGSGCVERFSLKH